MGRSLGTRVGVLVGVVVLAAGLLTACELAVLFTVDSTADAPDADPGDGECASVDGTCTLRAAVMEANTLPLTITTTIALEADTYQLSLIGADDAGAVGDLDVWSNLIIEGGGATVAGLADHRVLEHHAGKVTVHALTIRGGAPTASGDGTMGGGVLNHAELHLLDSFVIANATSRGGTGIHQTEGRTTLLRSAVRNNNATAFGSNAGVWIDAGEVVVFDSEISFNQRPPLINGYGPSAGSGIRLIAGSTSITNSTITGHLGSPIPIPGLPPDYALGQGVWSDADVTIVRSTLVFNGFDLQGTGSFEMSGSIIDRCEAAVTSGGYNTDSGRCLDVRTTGDDSVSRTPVARLGANGGPTLTTLPLAGAPVVDAIPLGTPVLCDATFPTGDQRQLPRPAGSSCDKGAVERQPSDPALPEWL
jgi:CSLREA domain-containing protein